MGHEDVLGRTVITGSDFEMYFITVQQRAVQLETVGQEEDKIFTLVFLDEFCQKSSHVYISPKIYLLAHIRA